jgi:hypothetical protein
VLAEDLEDPVDRKRLRDMAGEAPRGGGGEQRVERGFFGVFENLKDAVTRSYGLVVPLTVRHPLEPISEVA